MNEKTHVVQRWCDDKLAMYTSRSFPSTHHQQQLVDELSSVIRMAALAVSCYVEKQAKSRNKKTKKEKQEVINGYDEMIN
jgi:hypothetical protein